MLSYYISKEALLLAIHLSAPNLNAHTADYYGTTIQKEAIRTETSPAYGIAIIDHESRWNALQISRDHEDYGLMQIRARFARHPEWLLDGRANIKAGFGWIDSSKDFCEKELGREPEGEEWLSCYQGSCGRVKHRCKPTRLTGRVEKYAQCITDAMLTGVCTDCEYIYIGNYSK